MIPMTPWVKRLLIANVAVYFLVPVGTQLYQLGMFYPPAILVRPWTPVTYMFLHGGFTHLLFNMIGLFFFGPRLEQWLGGKDFLLLYFLSGLGAALLSIVFAPNAAVVGASGAVYGILIAFATIWPRERIYIWGVLPVEAWLLALFMVGGSLWAGITGTQAGTAHFAHLGGIATGFGFIRIREWRKGSAKRDFQKKLRIATEENSGGVLRDRSAMQRWESIDTEKLHELNRDEVEFLLDKARTAGVKTLSQSEREFLERMAKAR